MMRRWDSDRRPCPMGAARQAADPRLGLLPVKSLAFGQTLDPSMNPSHSEGQFPCLQVTVQSVCLCRALGFVHQQEEPRHSGSPRDTRSGCPKPLWASLSLRPSVSCCFSGILRPDGTGTLLPERDLSLHITGESEDPSGLGVFGSEVGLLRPQGSFHESGSLVELQSRCWWACII